MQLVYLNLLEFLSKQFDICQNDIENMSRKEWNAIRKKCFEIDEMLIYEEKLQYETL